MKRTLRMQLPGRDSRLIEVKSWRPNLIPDGIQPCSRLLHSTDATVVTQASNFLTSCYHQLHDGFGR